MGCPQGDSVGGGMDNEAESCGEGALVGFLAVRGGRRGGEVGEGVDVLGGAVLGGWGEEGERVEEVHEDETED